MIYCSVGICVYNEEKNIHKLLKSLLNQRLKNVGIKEILVIASGTTDRTCEIVLNFAKTYKNIRLYKQKKREGKASAVNFFVKKSRCSILVLIGGDLLLKQNVIEKLVSKFHEEEVGMTGGHPIPVNITKGLAGFAGYLLWELHHKISLKEPKMGEVIAFRKAFKRIPTIGADEASIEPLIRGQGYKILYVPDAIVNNKAPTNIRDFISQRRRNFWLHLIVKYKQSYIVSTMNVFLISKTLASYLSEHRSPRYFALTPLVICIEVYSRFLGWWDYKIIKKRHTVWEFIESTK